MYAANQNDPSTLRIMGNTVWAYNDPSAYGCTVQWLSLHQYPGTAPASPVDLSPNWFSQIDHALRYRPDCELKFN